MNAILRSNTMSKGFSPTIIVINNPFYSEKTGSRDFVVYIILIGSYLNCDNAFGLLMKETLDWRRDPQLGPVRNSRVAATAAARSRVHRRAPSPPPRSCSPRKLLWLLLLLLSD